MNKLEKEFETWWEREGQKFLFALNTTTDDDIKLVAEIAWKNWAYCAEQAEQEPVAWARTSESGEVLDCISNQYKVTQPCTVDYDEPLYAAPVRTKDLTDDLWYQSELFKLAVSRGLLTIRSEFVADPADVNTKVSWMEGHATSCDISNESARAVIAADRKLNGVEK